MHINNLQRLSIVIVGILTFAGLLLLSLKISASLTYTDFIAGHIAWTRGTKLQDLLVMPLSIIGTSITVIMFLSFFEKINRTANKENTINIAQQIIYWSIPATAIIVSSLAYKNFDRVFYAVSMLGIIFFTFSYIIASKKYRDIPADTISIGLVSIFFLALAPLNFYIAIKFFPGILQDFGGFDPKFILRSYFSLLIILLFGYLFLYRIKNNFPYKELSILILLGQLFLPLLYLSLYPAKLQDPTGSLTSFSSSIGLKLIIAGLIAISFADIIYRHVKYRSTQTLSPKLLSPLAIFAFLFALKAGVTNAPHVPVDDYHFGEHLLGWWVYLQGYIPYIDYIPVHGIINNDLSGLINTLFYEGTAGSLAEAKRFTILLLSMMAFFSIYYFTGSILWAFLSVYLLGARLTWLFFIPFLALWFNRSLIENKIKWSAVWFITAPIMILGVPPQGILLVAASGVIPIYFLWHTIANRNWKVIKPVALWGLAVCAFYAITPLGKMLINAINYVYVNGSINQAAYGVPWEVSFASSSILTEAIRMSWVIAPLASLLALYFLYRSQNVRPFLALPLCVTIIISFLLIPYSMGRIDPGGPSRPGIVAILLIVGLMSLSFWHLFNRYSRIWLFLGIVFFSSLLNFANLSYHPVLSTAAPTLHVSNLVDTSNSDLSNIGTAIIDGAHIDRLNKLNTLLNNKLQPQESYLDLTSRNAQYFYLNRRPIIPVTAPYNMISYKQQFDAIAVLKNNLPRVALLEGMNIIHDGGGVSIRNHYLYRFLTEQYEPFEENGFIIGLSTESIARGDWGAIKLPTQMEKMELFERAFSRARINLEKLPSSWGKSVRSLEYNMKLVANLDNKSAVLHDVALTNSNTFEVKGQDPFAVYDISHLAINGKSAGLLRFEFECIAKKAPALIQVFVWGDERTGPYEASSFFFNAENGSVIVPLDILPRWLLLNHAKGIRIDLSNSGSCASYKIENISLHQRTLVNL
jgi:hypothetical protein